MNELADKFFAAVKDDIETNATETSPNALAEAMRINASVAGEPSAVEGEISDEVWMRIPKQCRSIMTVLMATTVLQTAHE